MARLGIANMMFGFTVLFLSACAGAFIATDTTDAYLRDPELLNSWKLMIDRSAHGHANLFGILHICLGLTLPYSKFGFTSKKLQSVGLALGTVAMMILMVFKGFSRPTTDLTALDVLIGTCLSAAILALASHAFGLARKLCRTP